VVAGGVRCAGLSGALYPLGEHVAETTGAAADVVRLLAQSTEPFEFVIIPLDRHSRSEGGIQILFSETYAMTH
jgi:hypothetical protein